jgi:hypothetical protein
MSERDAYVLPWAFQFYHRKCNSWVTLLVPIAEIAVLSQKDFSSAHVLALLSCVLCHPVSTKGHFGGLVFSSGALLKCINQGRCVSAVLVWILIPCFDIPVGYSQVIYVPQKC